MKLHEYQAKQLLKTYGVPVPNNRVAATPEEAEAAAEALGWPVVIKAQVHAGGRGKGVFAGTDVRGVVVVHEASDVGPIARAMLGGQLVTYQSGPEGVYCDRVLVEEGVDIACEYYLGITLDRARSQLCVMASREGGVAIEEVAARDPDAIYKQWIDPALGLMPYQARRLGYELGLEAAQLKGFCRMVAALAKAYTESDASLLEINPLIVTGGGEVLALDAKLSVDDNALFRHADLVELAGEQTHDAIEAEARELGLSYIKLDGTVGCMVNGAGLAMSTMDIIKLHGGSPANFLDVGGSANQATVTAAFKIILSDPNVKAVLVNIFGGIMHCDVIAEGVIGAVREVNLSVPLVVRLEGTNVDKGKALLRESGLPIIEAADLADAAQKAVAAAAG